MNWKKLVITITAVNLLAWGMIEIWHIRYASMDIAPAATGLIIAHLIGYYIIAIASRVELSEKKCNHDWQLGKYSTATYPNETCTKCKAERGVKP